MVRKWLNSRKSKQRRIPQIDLPPVTVTESALGVIPPCKFASISLFQNSLHHQACINYFAASNSGNAVHLAFLTPSQIFKNGSPVRQIAQDCWVHQNVSDPDWLDSTEVWMPWLHRLQESLTDFGGGTLSASFQGISIDKNSNTAQVYLSGLASATLVTHAQDIQQLHPRQQTGRVGDLRSSLPYPQKLSTKDLTSMILTSDDYQQERVIQGIREIRKLPFPKAGAAELLFFELQKTGNGSSVLWIEFE